MGSGEGRITEVMVASEAGAAVPADDEFAAEIAGHAAVHPASPAAIPINTTRPHHRIKLFSIKKEYHLAGGLATGRSGSLFSFLDLVLINLPVQHVIC